MIEHEKLLIHGLRLELLVEPHSNKIKSGPKRSSIDDPIDRFDMIFETLKKHINFSY